MNLLTMSKEIQKINNKISFLQHQNTDVISQIDKNLDEIKNMKTEILSLSDFFQLTNEIKDTLNDLESKVNNLYNLDPTKKLDRLKVDHSEIYKFLNKLNINEVYINKILFLNCESLKEFMLIEEELFDKLDIPLNIIEYIKSEIQEDLYQKMS